MQQGCELPNAPTLKQASDGTEGGTVLVQWSAVPGTLYYEVYRGETDKFSESELLASTENTYLNDASAAEASMLAGCWGRSPVYTYWVVAVNDCGPSAPSGPDDGYAGNKSLLATGAGKLFKSALDWLSP